MNLNRNFIKTLNGFVNDAAYESADRLDIKIERKVFTEMQI